MLSKEDNELLCRVGPGTPMGSLLREYWIPVLLSSELPEPDGPPERVRLLGEEHVPQSGGALLVPNHMSFVDGLLLLAATDRPIRFVVDAGYASQAHMTDEVRRLTGTTPVRFLKDALLTAA